MTAMLLAFALLAQDTVDNPEYKGWAPFKPGSSVTYKLERNGAPQEGTQKSTLKSVSETEAVIETEIVQKGAAVGKPFERKIPAKVPAEKQGKVLKTGEEEIEVAGKKMTCAWKEIDSANPSRPGTMKVWISDEIPGKGARIELTGASGGKSVMIAS